MNCAHDYYEKGQVAALLKVCMRSLSMNPDPTARDYEEDEPDESVMSNLEEYLERMVTHNGSTVKQELGCITLDDMKDIADAAYNRRFSKESMFSLMKFMRHHDIPLESICDDELIVTMAIHRDLPALKFMTRQKAPKMRMAHAKTRIVLILATQWWHRTNNRLWKPKEDPEQWMAKRFRSTISLLAEHRMVSPPLSQRKEWHDVYEAVSCVGKVGTGMMQGALRKSTGWFYEEHAKATRSESPFAVLVSCITRPTMAPAPCGVSPTSHKT